MGMTTNRKLSCCVTIIAALAASTLVFAKPKDKEKEKDNESEVKFTARSELVLIPALVTDKSGNHILGLKKEDFTVLENGTEQKVATSEEITTAPNRLSLPRNPNPNLFSNSVAAGPSADESRSSCSTSSTRASPIRHTHARICSNI